MKETLKNMFYIGAGAAFLTKEKLEELKNDLIEKGNVTQEEGKQLLEEMFKKSEEAKDQIEQKIQDAVTDQLRKQNVATGDDIAELKSQVEELKAMLERMSAEE
jgi:polyhydroxyalkanoate synthesis regulator phasin